MKRISHSGKLLREFVGFAHVSKAYWIVPLVIVLAVAALAIVASNAAAPLLYTLF